MRFEFLKHSEIPKGKLYDVISLKNIHWPYSKEEHLNWITKNMNLNDIHVLVYEESDLVAYLNLIESKVIIENKNHIFLGIGNVCSKVKSKGYGSLLIKEVDKYIVQQNKTGILLCKDSLIDFYLKNDWELLDKNDVEANFNLLNTMIFNRSEELKNKKVLIEKEF
jgi:hypothetical protein